MQMKRIYETTSGNVSHLRKTRLRVSRGHAAFSSWMPMRAGHLSLDYTVVSMDDQHRTMTISHCGRHVTVSIHADRYTHGGGLAVQLIDEADGMPYATVSVNFEGLTLKDDEFVFKTYSENEGLLEELLAADVIGLTGQSTELGPVCRLLAGGH